MRKIKKFFYPHWQEKNQILYNYVEKTNEEPEGADNMKKYEARIGLIKEETYQRIKREMNKNTDFYNQEEFKSLQIKIATIDSLVQNLSKEMEKYSNE